MRPSVMRPRIVLLLIVTIAAGVAAGVVGQATAGKKQAVAPLHPSLPKFGKCPILERYRPAFEQAARETGFPLALLAAVANVESSLDPNALSPAGAPGLFQILPSTAKELHLDISTPEKNIIAGARYLKILERQFQATDLMLAAYNAGPTAVIQAGGAPNAESLAYVNKVMALWKSLNGCRQAPSSSPPVPRP